MEELKSYLCGEWSRGSGEGSPLLDPATGEVVARASTEGLDLPRALSDLRERGGPALRALTFAERGTILEQLSQAVHEKREELIELSRINGGATRQDGKFDVDGASQTLMAYARWGKALGDRRFLLDGEVEQLGRSPRFSGQHVKVPLRGVAVHINAYNFPCWGPAEKMACAVLAGMPVLTKPATSTALPSFRMAEAMVASGAMPAGSFAFLAGSPGTLLDHLGPQDVVAFTGSAATGRRIRGHDSVLANNVRVNVEADSLNAMVLGPDVEPGSETWRLFVHELVREMTQKCGQKCTATRRVMVTEAHLEPLREAVAEELAAFPVGIPGEEGVRVGPLAVPAQKAALLEVLDALAGEVEVGHGEIDRRPEAFQAPLLLICRDPHAARKVHELEPFGPVATAMLYDGSAGRAAELVARGEGTLVSSVYSDDLAFTEELLLELAPWTGRLLLGSKRIAEHSTGPGLVLPMLTHGGPGRAGGGCELGGLRGLDLYLQRCAVQGARPVLERLLGIPKA